jgi:hypothetical protein
MKLLNKELDCKSANEKMAAEECIDALASGKIDVAAAHRFFLLFDCVIDPVDCDALLGRAKLIIGGSGITEEEQNAMEAAELAFAEDFGD